MEDDNEEITTIDIYSRIKKDFHCLKKKIFKHSKDVICIKAQIK